MKTSFFLKSILLALFLLEGFSSIGQELGLNPESPTVSGLSQYESNPIDMSTGIPDISIPIYKMPTRAKEIDIALSLSYHLFNVASYDSLAGNCGRGWTLNDGGSIYRKMEAKLANDTIANQKGVYHFNFRGYNGQFKVSRSMAGVWSAEVSENQGAPLQISIQQVNDYIESFTIYDDLGFGYRFKETDKYTYSNKVFDYQYQGGLEYKIPHKSAYHLEAILDQRGVTLALYNYITYHPIEDYISPPGIGTQKLLSSITVPGYGSIVLNKIDGFAGKFVRYSSIQIKNELGEVVRKFEMNYHDNLLDKVTEGDSSMSNTLSHKLYYRESVMYPTSQIVDIDYWGFYNLTEKSALWRLDRIYTRVPSELMAQKNALQKIEFPTGGCVVYKYELNTFSIVKGSELGWVKNETTNEMEESPSYFTALNSYNTHNYNFTPFPLTSTGPSTWQFSVSGGPKTICFKLDSTPLEFELGENNPDLFYPLGAITGGYIFGGMKNGMNANHGVAYTLPNGTYNISLTSPATMTPNGTASAEVATLVPFPEKSNKGNGIRIAKAAYFNDGSISKDYFFGISTVKPDRLISYDYNFANRPDRSSGSIDFETSLIDWDGSETKNYNKPSHRCEPVVYKNVTVVDSNTPGKTVYDFTIPSSNPQAANTNNSFAFTRPMRVTMFNTIGDTVRTISYTYTKKTGFSTGPRVMYNNMDLSTGWMEKKSMHDETFYPGGQKIEKHFRYQYGLNRRISTQTESMTIAGDSLVTKFYYHVATPLVNNRIGRIQKIEKYRNSELLSTSKINYQKDWAGIDEGDLLGLPNPSWLVASDSISKGNRPGKVNIKYNKYDEYSHPLEVEQDGGIKTVLLWGYHHTQIVARIENIDYASVPKTLIDAIRDASDANNETNLQSAFASLRSDTALAAARVTTYSYIPLVGIKTVTDPNGFKTTYNYDSLGRLIDVRDNDGKLLSENEYHYRTQN